MDEKICVRVMYSSCELDTYSAEDVYNVFAVDYELKCDFLNTVG